MPTNVDIVRGGYEAFARGDLPDVMAMLDPGIEWYAPDELPGGGTYRGTEQVAAFLRELPHHYEELSVQPRRFLAADDCVVVEGVHTGRIHGTAFDAGFAHVWTLREGKATRFREYMDSGRLLRLMIATAAASRSG
jgi:uncharacterized protein